MIELIYSRQSSDFIKGRAYSNPRFYSGPRSDVAKVYLVGDWPKIKADYEALGIPVESLDPAKATSIPGEEIGPTIPLVSTLSEEEREAVPIPDDWSDLTWPQLRSLATKFASEPVLNKADASGAIEAELARRASEAADSVSTT